MGEGIYSVVTGGLEGAATVAAGYSSGWLKIICPCPPTISSRRNRSLKVWPWEEKHLELMEKIFKIWEYIFITEFFPATFELGPVEIEKLWKLWETFRPQKSMIRRMEKSLISMIQPNFWKWQLLIDNPLITHKFYRGMQKKTFKNFSFGVVMAGQSVVFLK